MKCLNTKCVANINKKCINFNIVSGLGSCNIKHIPNYAEEQLQNTIDKENRCYNKECQHIKENQCYILKTKSCSVVLKEPINYKEEYNKLKKENKGIKEDSFEQEYYNVFEEYSKIKKENEELTERNNTQYDTINKLIKEKDNYKEIAENQNKKIEELERLHENQRINIKYEMEENKKLKLEIKQLKENFNKVSFSQEERLSSAYEERSILISHIEELEVEIKNRANQCSVCTKDIEVKRLEKSTNEYYIMWIEEQKENIKLTKENEENKIKVDLLKKIIKDLNELI